jgi:RNA polymerase sigma factor (sigma-70 family)
MLGELDQRRRGRLIAFATVLAGADLADDLVQDAVIATFTKMRSFDSVEQAEAYVRRAIATRYIDLIRKDRSRAARERLTAPDEIIAAEETYPMSGIVASALASLSPQVRACIVLRYLDDMSIRTTASVLNLAEGTVKRYVSNGLHELNQSLGTDENLEALDIVDVVSPTRTQEASK